MLAATARLSVVPPERISSCFRCFVSGHVRKRQHSGPPSLNVWSVHCLNFTANRPILLMVGWRVSQLIYFVFVHKNTRLLILTPTNAPQTRRTPQIIRAQLAVVSSQRIKCRRLIVSQLRALLVVVVFFSSYLWQPAGVPSAPSMAEAFLLADDPTGVRVYWSDTTNDRGSEVGIESTASVHSSSIYCRVGVLVMA